MDNDPLRALMGWLEKGHGNPEPAAFPSVLQRPICWAIWKGTAKVLEQLHPEMRSSFWFFAAILASSVIASHTYSCFSKETAAEWSILRPRRTLRYHCHP
jgi:hypothetical protein